MILLHQIWNQRRQNLWIFIELLIAGFFLWMVIDPIYVLTANRLIPQGGDTRGMYVLNLGQYDKSFGEYDSTQDSAQVMRRHYQDIVRAVRTCPEVEAFTVSAYSSFPNGMSWSGMELFNEDSVRVHVQQYRFIPLDGSDLPKTYGMVDVRTGQPVTLPADFAQRRMIALSERAARDLFGTTAAVGLSVYESPDRENPHEVAAVFRNYKHFSYPAAYSQSTNQRKSCGSILAGFSYSQHNITCDHTMLPSEIQEQLRPSLTFEKVKYNDYNLSVGYGYNWVFAKNCLLNLSLLPAIAYKKARIDDALPNNQNNWLGWVKDINFDLITRAGLTWNNGKYYVGASLVLHTYDYRKDNFSMTNSFGSLRVYAGFNFWKKKEYRHQQSK